MNSRESYNYFSQGSDMLFKEMHFIRLFISKTPDTSSMSSVGQLSNRNQTKASHSSLSHLNIEDCSLYLGLRDTNHR